MEVMVDNRDGLIWDVSSLVSDVSWKTSRVGKPSTFSFTCVKGSPFEDSRFKLEPGNLINVTRNGRGIFFGYVFTVESSQDEKLSITAYDQVRYLQANDSMNFTNMTATAVIRKIANEYQLKTGKLAETGYVIPSMPMKDKKLIDMICQALEKTTVGEKKIYTFYDHFGELTLQSAQDMLLDLWIGDGSLMTGYSYTRSIDNDTYNHIQMRQDDQLEQEGKERKPLVWKDSASIAKWGRLQFYKSIDGKMNLAQLAEYAANLLALHNREQQKLSLEAIGDLRVRAGCYLRVYIEELGIKQAFLVEECTHDQLEEEESIMKLELKVI
ncbi:hypothetical protein [Gorillibacterium sp. CAU 1737]|uniref:XkdQ/YqbQ family protein n=1 Tax=Gorillibacterium sp. CAU 1737 TaxID=3140362 RepID=UPI00326030F6